MYDRALTELIPEGKVGDLPEQGAVGVDQETGEELLYESAVGRHKAHTVHIITAHRASSSQHSLRRRGITGSLVTACVLETAIYSCREFRSLSPPIPSLL